ncbi:MAG: ATP-binding cassette domain-containing protein [Thiogranum sp.]|nr:ATP-binding cassette domain-containing protein [Thiogranum sp.]
MLQFDNLSLRRGPRLLFEQASLQIHPGQKVGVTGANGSGKSSLFGLILDQLHADEGDFRRPRDWVIAHVEQETPADARAAIDYVLDGDSQLRDVEKRLAIAERDGDGTHLAELHAQFDAVDGYTARSRAGQLLSGLGFRPGDELRPVTEFSGGWRMRLNLARALMCRSDLLLLDEPTNHLDLDAVIWLENWLQSYPGTLLLISHDREFLDSVTGNIAHLEQQRLTLYSGNYSAFERLRAARLANQQADYIKQQREIAHIRSYVDRFRAQATKARQAQSRMKALERMEEIAPAHVDSPFHFSFREPEKLPDPLLNLQQVAAGYGTTAIIADVSLSLPPDSRIGLLGPNGAGKSTLIKLLAGSLPCLQGKRETARDLKVGYFAQHQLEQLHPQHSPMEHMRQLDPQAREQELRDFLGNFGFSNDQALAPTRHFSGGEKSRLALALVIYQRPNLLLLDEPTNHLDLEMRQALALALQDFAGAMILVSHDRHLLRVSCDQLLLVHDGRVEEFPDSLDEYIKWLADVGRQARGGSRDSDAGDGINSAAARKEKKRLEAERRRQLQPLRNKVGKAETELEKLHARQAELENRLTDQAIYTAERKAELQSLLLEKADLDTRCAAVELEWMTVSEELEALRAEN